MTWYRIHHPDLNAYATVADTALPIHRARGWWRIGPPATEQDLAVATFDEPVDLDAAAEPDPQGPPAPTVTEPAAAPTPKSKEK